PRLPGRGGAVAPPAVPGAPGETALAPARHRGRRPRPGRGRGRDDGVRPRPPSREPGPPGHDAGGPAARCRGLDVPGGRAAGAAVAGRRFANGAPATIEHRDTDGNITRTINLKRLWRRVRYRDLMREVAGKNWFELSAEQRRQRAMNEFELEILPQLTDFEVTQHVFEKLIEEKTIDPLFVTHCPKELVPLAKQNIGDSSLVDVFELVINGTEIAPGYSELNDPIVQRQRLLEQAGQEKQKIDEEFLLALEHGMP